MNLKQIYEKNMGLNIFNIEEKRYSTVREIFKLGDVAYFGEFSKLVEKKECSTSQKILSQ